jgi:hypothetical protein
MPSSISLKHDRVRVASQGAQHLALVFLIFHINEVDDDTTQIA